MAGVHAAKVPMNGTVMVTGLMMGGQKSPPPSPPCTSMDLGGGCPVLQVCPFQIKMSFSSAAQTRHVIHIFLAVRVKRAHSRLRAGKPPNCLEYHFRVGIKLLVDLDDPLPKVGSIRAGISDIAAMASGVRPCSRVYIKLGHVSSIPKDSVKVLPPWPRGVH